MADSTELHLADVAVASTHENVVFARKPIIIDPDSVLCNYGVKGGPSALTKIFGLLGIWLEEANGMKGFLYEWPLFEIEERIQSIVTKDPEVKMVLLLIRFLRDATMEIDDELKTLSKQVTCNWLSHSTYLFTPRFMYSFTGSRYFKLFAEIEKPTPKEIISAWLADLRGGLYPVCRNVVVSHFDDFLGNFANEKQYAQGMAQLLTENDLVAQFRVVPDAMISLARLNGVSMYLPK